MKPNADDSNVNINNNLVNAQITVIPSFAHPYIPESPELVQLMTDSNTSNTVGHYHKSGNESIATKIRDGKINNHLRTRSSGIIPTSRFSERVKGSSIYCCY